MERVRGGAVRAWVPVALLALAALIWLAVVWLPAAVYPAVGTDELRGADLEDKERFDVEHARLQLQGGVRAVSAQLIIGLGALAGALLGWRQFHEDRSNRRDDFHLKLFGEALEAVGSERSAIRRAGAHTFGRLAAVSPDDRPACRDVLLALVQEGAGWPPGAGRPGEFAPSHVPTGPGASGLAPDVQTALSLLVREPPEAGRPGLSLRGLDLRGADLDRAQLARADLTATHLDGAWLAGADLTGAQLVGTSLLSVVLREGVLDGCTLDDVDLGGAVLTDVSLRGASYRSVRWPDDFREAEARAHGAVPAEERQLAGRRTSG